MLMIIKYNKKIQSILNQNISDYKHYLRIEIEIIPDCSSEFGNEYENIFFNNERNELYYRIYFNDDKKEIERNYLTREDNVIKIIIIIDYQTKSLDGLFKNCGCINSINFKYFYRNDIKSMKSMFENG